eukprot:TRINITY_DN1465_c0_g2_i3.p1 TRINITY_DN1465_c0_g2~~TRINITY_DN1465_c0_g2_i3.p1  ORF type:complete len:738 (+),score=285.81 TRINITY_DN1465_c0_g2_i3:224-2215(+)
MRNIGISAHIDSGKTTLTERILFYTGKILEMHEVKGKDGVGATMDSMELEREKGITIQSAATYATWQDYQLNIIDTPGHVDFTIEVERALRVLDGAILVICGVAGVQSQTFTVDRQMRRYNVPRLIFINKLDRVGAEPWRVIENLKKKLNISIAALQVPIGLEHVLQGVVDIVTKKAYYFDGEKGSNVTIGEIPESLIDLVNQKREELISQIIDIDDQLAEIVFINERQPTPEELKAAIRRSTLALKFSPVLMGSAYKNKGVQPLLDAVIDYLPNPNEKDNYAIDLENKDSKIKLECNNSKPFVGLAFKLEEGRFGQLTYIRVYQGILSKGSIIQNVTNGRKIKVPRLCRMHANNMEDIELIGAGEICAVFGVDCHSGTTFTDGQIKCSMLSMHVPEPVISLAITTDSKKQNMNFIKALQRFQKEDPTFKVFLDPESSETIISGMGELHLEIYAERMRREYGIPVTTGKPQVAYRETITSKGSFSYQHKKQSGGAGQFAKMCGYLEIVDQEKIDAENEFSNEIVGSAIPAEFIPACQKGFFESLVKGPLIGAPVVGVRMILNDGSSHSVDSSDLAFRICANSAFREGFFASRPSLLEPVMSLEITVPTEYQGTIMTGVNKRKGSIVGTESLGELTIISAQVIKFFNFLYKPKKKKKNILGSFE